MQGHSGLIMPITNPGFCDLKPDKISGYMDLMSTCWVKRGFINMYRMMPRNLIESTSH